MKISFFFCWGIASEENEERREVNGCAVLWERAATEINVIRSTREMMSQGVGGGIWYPWTATIVVANNPDTPVDERFLTVEEKDSRHERNTQKELSVTILHHWNSNYCGAKLESSNQQWNDCWPILVLILQMWLCRTGFPVRWLQHFHFVEQFNSTRGIFIILFSLLVKEGLKN